MSRPLAPKNHITKNEKTTEIYIPIHQGLLWDEHTKTLNFTGVRSKGSCSFESLILPHTIGYPRKTNIGAINDYKNTAIALADLVATSSKDGDPNWSSIRKRISSFRNVMEWLRNQGTYRLHDANPEQFIELSRVLAEGSWYSALRISARIDIILSEMDEQNIGQAFYLDKSRAYRSFNRPFWSEKLGTPFNALEADDYLKVGIWLSENHITLSDYWSRLNTKQAAPPCTDTLKNTLTSINSLHELPPTVDRLQFLPFYRANSSARKLSQKESGRTTNLSIDDAATLLTGAMKIVFEKGPEIVQLLSLLRQRMEETPEYRRIKLLCEFDELHNLLKELNLPRIDTFDITSRTKNEFSVTELVGFVQASCAVVIAALNARRNGEVCDPNLGVRIKDFSIMDEELEIYQCWFYIQKTYRERHPFYVTGATAKSIKLLIELKRTLLPSNMNLMPDGSIFACGILTRYGVNRESGFNFRANRAPRSLTNFFNSLFSKDCPKLTPHMFRRFFALIYYYRYENKDLRALSQHLRHFDIAMTAVYLSDASSIADSANINNALRLDNSSDEGDDWLLKNLDIGSAALSADMMAVSQEKLLQTVSKIIQRGDTAGGFSRFVRKYYIQMCKSSTFSELSIEEQIERIGMRLTGSKYSVTPMRHGQCHAKNGARNTRARCSTESNDLARENASPATCRGCIYHFNSHDYLMNLKEDLESLSSECNDFLLSPIQQAKAKSEHENLLMVISLNERTIIRNEMLVKIATQKLD